MQNKTQFFLLFLFILSSGTYAQHISVKSFEVLPKDQDARVTSPVTDQNGEKCALIKVVTNRSGFVWEGGMLGITKTVKKTGEYWVYVPWGSKKLTIKHEKLGVLRDYVFPGSIKKATVYEMVLTTRKEQSLSSELESKTGNVYIITTPVQATVYVDGEKQGISPITLGNMLTGKHELTIKKDGYEPLHKSLYIKENQTTTVDTKLQKKQEPTHNFSEYTGDKSVNKSQPSKTNFSKNKYRGGPANMFLSLLVPGLGDKYVSGKSGADRTLTTYGLIAGGLACKFYSDYQYKNYSNATLQSEMDTYYSSANKYNKLYYVLTASGIAYWIYDIIWVAVKGFKNKRIQRAHTSNFDMHYDPVINGLAVSVNIKF